MSIRLVVLSLIVTVGLLTPRSAHATTAGISWDPNSEPDLAGYRVHYGESGVYSQMVDVGRATTYTVTGLREGMTYYFSVTAYDSAGNESGYSLEASKTIPDTSGPVVSGVSAVDITSVAATITWRTNEAATSQVDYGLTASYGSSTPLDSARMTTHRMILAGLTPSTLYHYRVRSRDAAGNESVGPDATFQTVLLSGTTPPAPVAWWGFGAPDGTELAPTAGLVGLWHFNESGGATAADASGRGQTGTVNGAAFTTAGRFKRALAFDGLSQSVAVPTVSALGNLGAQMTIEAWVKPGVLDGAMRKLVDLRNAGATCDSYVWQFGNFSFGTPSKPSTMRASGGCGGSSINTLEGNRFAVYTQYPFAVGTWYHVAVVYHGGLGTAAQRARLYVNGVDVTHEPHSTGNGGALYVTTDNPLRVGRNGVSASQYFKGSLDELAIFNVALTPSQVAEHYRRGFAAESIGGVADVVDPRDGRLVGPTTGSGRAGSGLVFDGTDDRVTVPHHAALDPANGWTLSAWVKRSVTGVQHSVIEKFDWAPGLGGYAMRISADNRLRGYVINGTAYNACVGQTLLAAQVWYHVAVAFDPVADALRCYVNGAVDGANTSATVTPVSSRTALKIGARGNDEATPFGGTLDEVKVFDRVLNSAEVASEAGR